MRSIFIAFVLGVMLAGCYDNHGRFVPVIVTSDAGPSVGDAGPMPVPDAGTIAPDSGPVIVADAGTDAFVPPTEDAGSDAGMPPEPDSGPVVDAGPLPVELTVTTGFSGWDTPVGQQDMATSNIGITAVAHDLEWREGVYFRVRATTPGCMVRGSLGTEYFRDIKARDYDTGLTLMGPVSMPTLADGATSTGFFRIGMDPRTIPAGATWRFSVTMDLSSVEDAPGEFIGCGYEVYTGMEGGSVIEASSIRYPGGATLRPEQIGGDNAASYSGFHVLSSLIEPGLMPPSDILIAGDSRWRSVASYEVVRSRIRSVFVMIDGYGEDTSAVAIARYDAALGTNVIIGRTILATGMNSGTNILLDTPVEAGDAFEIWVMVPPVVSYAVSGGTHDGRTMSGDSFRMGVNAYSTGSPTFFLTEPMFGNEFVIRRSVPVITRQALSTTTISNGTDQDLYRFQVSADASGAIELARIGMTMEINSAAGRVCNLRLRRGDTVMSSSDYTISGPMFWGAERCWTAGTLPVITRFIQTVAGSGNLYTLFGTPEGFIAGDTIGTSFNRGDDRIMTGYLGSVWSSTSTDVAIDESPYGVPGSMRASASLIWSDLSEIPHSAVFGTDGGSRDWTNGYLLEDLTQMQWLTR